MLYHIVAGLFLLPASFVVFGRGWLRALRSGPWYFFGQIVKTGPQLVLKRGRLFNLFVFYPMRAGIEVERRRSLVFIIRSAVRLLLRHLQGEQMHIVSSPVQNLVPDVPPLPPLSTAALIHMVERPEVRVVSFDIFDTLLTRPVVDDPREIFHLVAARVNGRFGVDFVELRWNAEAEMGDRYATLEDIYAHIRRRHSLAPDVVHSLMQEELSCERALLRPRADMLEIYRAAVRVGKRIVAVSDMYLPSAFLLEVLHEKGFTEIATAYVSAECRVRKSDGGALFDVMLKAEGVPPEATLHLGDNRQGDIAAPLSRGIGAVHVPSVRQMLQERGGDMTRELVAAARRAPLWGLLLGHALERIFDKPGAAPETLERCDSSLLARLVLGPLVTSLCLRSQAVAEREHYESVYYASRDGWLPSQVHKVLREKLGGAEGVYFHAGRRAYFPFQEASFVEYARTRKLAANMERYTLEDLLRGFWGEDAHSLLEAMTPEERTLLFCKNQQKALAVLNRLSTPLEALMVARRERARRYYEKIFPATAQRFLVFDLGYSGSVSTALTAVTGRPVDKLYCWQTEDNAELDKQHGTRTFILVGGDGYSPFHLILEEMFAPCMGGVIDFDAQGQPRMEPFDASPAMRGTLECVHKECLDFAESAAVRFGEYAFLLAGDAPDCIPLFRQWFYAKPLSNLAQFRHVVFPDPVFLDRPQSLEEKLDAQLQQPHVFASTGFEDSDNVLPLWKLCHQGDIPRVGIHIHIYNGALAQEFARYAARFPVPFDLFVTHARSGDALLLHSLFNSGTLPQARRVSIWQTPNRGRDVAPWLVEVGREQLDYDLFCHVHSKESEHIGFGGAWRAYLLDNLLRPEAVQVVLSAFAADDRLGCVFPAIYGPLRCVMLQVGVPLYGSEHERDLITGLLTRMGLAATYGRNEQFFSGGTMMWYRPEALRPLLECGLRFDDFPEEPIGVGGTLAHALERVPALVCSRCGYHTRSLTCFPDSCYPLQG